VSSRRDEGEKETREMYGYRFNALEDRVLREKDLADRVAECERYLSQRARMETWRVVWERPEARGRL
jgi:hypothetical protein